MLLKLDVKVAENILEVPCSLYGFLEPAVREVPRDLTCSTAGERDDPLVVLLEQLPVHSWLVVIALKVRLGGERQQVGVTRVVLRQERHVVRLLVLRLPRMPGPLRHIGLDSDDRL